MTQQHISYKQLSNYELSYYSQRNNLEQTDMAIGAALTDEPTMPPDGINPLRWRAMVACMRNAIKLGLEDQI